MKFLFVLVISANSILLSSWLSAEQNTSEQTIKELSQLKNKIKTLQASLKSKRKQQSKAIVQLKRAEKKIATAAKILASTKRQLKSKEKSLKNLHKKQKRLKKQKKNQKEALAQQLRAAYMNGNQAYLKMLLNQQDPEKLGRMLVYYDYMNKARSKNLSKLKTTLTDIKKVDYSIQREIRRLKILKQSKINESKKLAQLKQQRQRLVKALSKEIVNKTDQLTELEINAEELQLLIDSVRETIDEMDFTQPLEGLKKLKGRLNWPVQGHLLRSFGSLTQGQRASGILISGKEGNEVTSVYHGRVVYADWLRGFGLLLILDHGQGYMSLYGYNQSLYKEVGDWVEAGEAVATLGQSGGQNKPALYFELRHQGKPINPKKWLTR
ncbi:MAG: peptidoglycan DD-metalloendopeptidase family protein [Enterobacterales bacterium]|nr:peptidoglycan DD-metalloendopeptidase family protein [Enterobacterales bacterium]